MKKLIQSIYLLGILLLTSCNSKSVSPECTDSVFSYDDKDYTTIKTHYDDFGEKYREILTSKIDTSLKQERLFWENGQIYSQIFFNNKKKNGPHKLFDSLGNLHYLGFFYQDKQTGITIRYDNEYQKASIQILKDNNSVHFIHK